MERRTEAAAKGEERGTVNGSSGEGGRTGDGERKQRRRGKNMERRTETAAKGDCDDRARSFSLTGTLGLYWINCV